MRLPSKSSVKKAVTTVLLAFVAWIAFCVVALLMFSFVLSLTNGLTNKKDIKNLFIKHEDAIVSAVNSGNLDEIEKIRGIQSVDVNDDNIEFSCGGKGMGGSTSYYGFFYSATDVLNACWCAPSSDRELDECGQGYKYQEPDGDNTYYVEKIGEHFFYYEAHF